VAAGESTQTERLRPHGQTEAAEAAFLSAISRNPSASQGYYAVAQRPFDGNRLDPSVASFCDIVIDLRPNRLSLARPTTSRPCHRR
jgi:hypothetical protein